VKGKTIAFLSDRRAGHGRLALGDSEWPTMCRVSDTLAERARVANAHGRTFGAISGRFQGISRERVCLA
jgi:hypothetical protein